MSFSEIEESIKNLESNIESVQGDLCEGLYSNIIEVSNNLQSNLDEVNIRTNDRISNLPGVKSEDIPDFINNYKNRLKISVDEFVTFVRYFNLVNSKLKRSTSEVYQLVFFGEKESVIKDIESTENETGLLDKNKFILKLKEDDLVFENVNDYIVDCENYDEEIEYLNRIIGNPENSYNRKTNGINYSLGIHELVLLKKEVIPFLREAGYGNNIFGTMWIFSDTYFNPKIYKIPMAASFGTFDVTVYNYEVDQPIPSDRNYAITWNSPKKQFFSIYAGNGNKLIGKGQMIENDNLMYFPNIEQVQGFINSSLNPNQLTYKTTNYATYKLINREYDRIDINNGIGGSPQPPGPPGTSRV